MEHAGARKRPPWRAWAIGAVAAVVGIGWAIAFVLHLVRMIQIEAAAVVGLAGVIIVWTARPEWVLEWSAGGRRNRLAQPFSWENAIEAEMSAALQEAGRLLADPQARAARLLQIRADRVAESDLNDFA